MTEDTIACPALEIKINDARCQMKQKEGIIFWGSAEKSTLMEGCPCEKGGNTMEDKAVKKEKRWTGYKSIGTCPICKRDGEGKGLRLYAYHGTDMCGGCKSNNGQPRPGAKAMVALRDRNPPRMTEITMIPSNPLDTSCLLSHAKKKYIETTLRFHKDDETEMAILKYVQAEAKRCMRLPCHQAMWILQAAMAGQNHVPNS